MSTEPPPPPRPMVYTPKRDVSPLGASRFERPFSATGRKSTSTSPSSPTAPNIPDVHVPARSSKGSSRESQTSSPVIAQSSTAHYSKPSLSSTAPTYSTAPTSTSLDHPDHKIEDENYALVAAPSDTDEREAWFMKQTAASDNNLPVGEGDECPDRATLAAVQDIPVYDAEGNAVPFGSLYHPDTTPHQRQLIIFVRHFYCGACQAYVKALVEGISIDDYYSIPTPTSIIIIGCGKPDLIPQYRRFTNQCQYTILAEPTRMLFKKLGMNWSMSLGSERPDYMREISVLDVVKGQVRDVSGAVKDPEGIRKRDVFRGGHPLQIGGEFLFEDGQVIWCHRMKHMRGHAEISVLRKLLELDD